MDKIIPRWEWRTFGHAFGPAEAAFAALDADRDPGERRDVPALAGGGDNVKVRDDLMDIKVLREVDADGLERWEPVMKAGVPAVRRRRRRRSLEALRARRPAPSSATSYTLDAVRSTSSPRDGAVRAVERPQAPGPLHGRRLHVRGDRRRRRRPRDADDRDRVRGRGGGRRRGPVGRPGRLPQHELPAGLAALLDGAPAALRGDRRRHQLGQVPRRRARRRGGWRPVVDRAEVTRLGEGLQERGEIAPDGAGAHDRRDRRHGRRGARARRRRDRRGRARPGCGSPRNGQAVVDAIAGRDRRPDRGHLGRGGEPAGLSRGRRGARPRRRHARRVRHRRRQHASSRSATATRVDERFSVDVGAVRYTERFGLDQRGRPPRCSSEALAAIVARPRRGSTAARGPTRWSGMGGAVTNIDRRDARPRDVRPRRRPGVPSSTAPRSIARSSSIGSRDADAPARDRRAPAQAGRRDPRRCLHRPDGHGQARPRRTHGERPRPAPRRAGGAIRRRPRAGRRSSMTKTAARQAADTENGHAAEEPVPRASRRG